MPLFKKYSFYGWLLLPFLIALAACSNTGVLPATATPAALTPIPASPVSTAPVILFPTPAASVTPEPPHPTATTTFEPTAAPLEPLITAPAVRFDSWSPDGEWLAYWISSAEEASGNTYPFPPGRLHFRSLSSGQECSQPEFIRRVDGDRLAWRVDGTVIFTSAEGSFQGAPCNDFAPVQTPASTAAPQVAGLSPGGELRAETVVDDSSAGILSLTTRLIQMADQQVVSSVNWKIEPRLGELGLGGEWLTNDQFLIYETLELGPLLVSASGKVIRVAQDLFGIEQLPHMLDPEGYTLKAAAIPAAGNQGYHLLLYGIGLEANFPPVKLYHSESGEVEEMPFSRLWSPAFSPDGKWLLLDERPAASGYESYALWLRPVDPPGSEVRAFASGSRDSLWSPDWNQVAFDRSGSVVLYDFPQGRPLNVWQTGAYSAHPAAWSPDGKYLLLWGTQTGQLEALFLVVNNP